MNEELESDLRTVRELFDGGEATYTVPIYQRNYAWGAEQIEQLIQDVTDALRDQEDGYFLGNLVVVDRAKDKSPNYEVIDGQQRLTTLYLLLTTLSNRGIADWSGHEERLQYESRTRSTEALRTVTATVGRASGDVGSVSTEDTSILAGLNIVRQCLAQQFSDDSPAAQAERTGRLDRFADYLRDHVTLVRARLPKSVDLNKYFEVMNTRGEQLAQVDIVKARLMSRLSEDPGAQACFGKVWEACADMDSYVQMALTKGDPTLRSRLFGDDWSWLRPRGWEELRELLVTDSGHAVAESGGSRSLDDALAYYASVDRAAQPPDEDSIRFRSTIEFPVFLLHALKVFRRAPDGEEPEDSDRQLDDKKLIKRFDDALGKSSAETIKQFAFDLLRLRNLFDGYVLKRQYTARTGDDGDWSLQRLVKQASTRATAGYRNTLAAGVVETDEDDADEATRDLLLLQSMLRVTYTSPRTMHWITLLLTHLCDAQSAEGAGREAASLLREFARAQVRDSYLTATPEPTGFAINRVVFTYLDYLYLQRAAAAEKADYRFGFRNSIEHFYPQHPDQEQHGSRVSPERLHLLGNLALVSVGVNSKFSNSLPRAKAENYRLTIENQSPKLGRMAELTRRGHWSDEEVRQHHSEILDMLLQDQCLASISSATQP